MLCHQILQEERKVRWYKYKSVWENGFVYHQMFISIFYTQVQSVLLYSSELWGINQCYVVDSVHLQAIKRFIDLPMNAPNVMEYGDTGRYLSFDDSNKILAAFVKDGF